MKKKLKREVLLPLLLIDLGIAVMVALVIVYIPYNLTAAYILMGAASVAVVGSIMLWRFIISELRSIARCAEALESGNVSNFHADRDDELGELEEKIIAASQH